MANLETANLPAVNPEHKMVVKSLQKSAILSLQMIYLQDNVPFASKSKINIFGNSFDIGWLKTM